MRVHIGACVGGCAFFRECVTMPSFRRLGKSWKNANNSLTTQDEVKLFSVQKLLTQAFLLVPKSFLYLLWY